MNLFKLFQDFVEKESLFNRNHKLLLALSGGADSMVLFSLLKHFEYKFEVAHVNFCLRGEESNEDEFFVAKFCAVQAIPCHIKHFDTKIFASDNGIGIQEAARILRKNWFEELRNKFSFDYILTAHHANDNAETILFHLMRGAGTKGLSGILSKKGNFIRPLLFAKKENILKHAIDFNIPYRTDSSNLKDDYTRNFLRNQIIPKLLSVQPAFIENTVHSGKLMEATQFYFQKQISEIRRELISHNGYDTHVQISLLAKMPFPSILLFELISGFGFNFSQCEDMINAFLKNHTGAFFNSGSHKALVNRTEIIISEPVNVFQELTISYIPREVSFGDDTLNFSETLFEGYSENCLWLDLDTLSFPLQLRGQKDGERFSPLGMKGSQKISDYFINNKIDRFAKSKSLVLLSKDQICALLPFQVSEKNKISDATKRYLKIEHKKRG